MKIAIVGAGFAGLSVAYWIQRAGFAPTVFSSLPGASFSATGLCQISFGSQKKSVPHANEAFLAAQELFFSLPDRSFILHRGCLRNGVFIKEAFAIDATAYLKALASQCTVIAKHIEPNDHLEAFDKVIYCTGASFSHPLFPLEIIKGQSLEYFTEEPLPALPCADAKQLIPLGPNTCIFGATYERSFSSPLPDSKEALRLLSSALPAFLQGAHVVSCRAGLRAYNRHARNLPLIARLDERSWYFGAFGSRGLLYSSFFAKNFIHQL